MEVEIRIQKLRRGKTPKLDEVKVQGLKVFQNMASGCLRETFNRCLREGRFSGTWKVGRVALMYKEGGAGGYIGQSMLLTAEKVLERLMGYILVIILEVGRYS